MRPERAEAALRVNEGISPDNRRAHDWIAVNRVFHSLDDLVREYASNLSLSGVFIRSGDPLPVGTTVDLRFTVLIDDFETIEGVGEVVRVVVASGEEPSGMGIRFTSLAARSRTLIERLVTHTAASL